MFGIIFVHCSYLGALLYVLHEDRASPTDNPTSVANHSFKTLNDTTVNII